jgi:cell division protein ZapA (FtsZ GTPase activity inhibitor)
MSKKSVAVKIAGHEYKIRSDADPDSLRQLASYVDRAMQRVREGTRTVDSLDVAMLTCLNLAREIMSLREGGVANDQLRALIERVESAVEVAAGEGQTSESDAVEAPLAESSEESSQVVEREPARTLELPSVESLRERSAEATAGDLDLPGEESVPEARVAAGGRDRAS